MIVQGALSSSLTVPVFFCSTSLMKLVVSSSITAAAFSEA